MWPSTSTVSVLQPFQSTDTLFKLLRQRAQAHADTVGYTFLLDGDTTEQNLTYGALDEQARAIAARVQSACNPGDHVLLLYGPGLDYIAGFLACQYAGVIPVPAYPPDPLRSERTLSRLQAIVSDCGATLALGSAENVNWLGSLRSGELGLRLTLSTDHWQEWVHLPWTAPETAADQVAWLQYTSGSTAVPRGVMVTHLNLWSQFDTMQVGDGDDSVGVSWLPFYHDMGLIGGILTPMAFCRRAILMSPLAFVQHPLRWLWAVSRYRATTTGGPNFAMDLCVNKFTAADAAGLDLSSLRILLTGAEPIRSESMDRFTATFAPYGFNPAAWRPCYGMAEATLGVTGIRQGAQLSRNDFSIQALEGNQAILVQEPGLPARRMVGCGWALEGTEVIIVDPARCTELPERQVGEVWVSGPNVAAGYWNRPEETTAIFHAHLADSGRGPFLRTGDLGFMHDRQLYLTGRSKELMVFLGRNVYPIDVEATTGSCHPFLKPNACAAFAIEAQGQEQLVVVQEITRPRKMDLDATAAAIRQAIQAEHRVPLSALVFIKSGTLPKTSSGKIQRHVARDLFLANQLEVIQQWQYTSALGQEPAPATPEQELPGFEAIRDWLVARIARHCGITPDRIDTDEALTRYVMDSVSAVSIAMEMQQWLGRAIAPTVLYDSPSIVLLAERLADPQTYTREALPLPVSVDQMSQGELDQALAQLLGEVTTPAQQGIATPFEGTPALEGIATPFEGTPAEGDASGKTDEKDLK